MRNETRIKFNGYLDQVAKLNGITSAIVKFNVLPSVQQSLETAIQESADFLKRINVIPVNEQEGEAILLGVNGPIAGRTNTAGGNRRNPADRSALAKDAYSCKQTNFDSAFPYPLVDAWAKFPDFQPRLTAAIAQRQALDRIMIGFNGTSYADPSNRAANPLLQDCGIGWLEKIRKEAPHRMISGVTVTARDEDNKIVAKGTYGNVSSAVYDAKNSLMDEWHKRNPDNVVILAGDLLTTSNFPAINAMSQTNPNTEMLAGQLIVAQERVGNMPTFIAPYFPVNGILITPFKNLSIYYQRGGLRRTIKEEPEYNRVATYQSSNDDFVVEDYGNVAFIDGITFAKPENGG